MAVKQKVVSYLRKNFEHTKMYQLLVIINQMIFHYDMREQKKCFGKSNSSKTFYVIRGFGKEAGLFALYSFGLNKIYECLKKGYIPIIDLKNDSTQYNMDVPIRDGIWNAWEYYFEQPFKEYSLEEVYQSQNVILSGWTFGNFNQRIKETIWESEKALTSEGVAELYSFASKYGKLNSEVLRLLSIEKNRVFEKKKNVLGVSVRGTDYIAFKPKGHCVQPELGHVIEKVKEFLTNYSDIDGIFLTTEDEQIYQKFINEFGEIVFTSNSNRIQDYSGDGYITTDLRKNNKYEQGLEYLIEKALLTECKYLVATRTAGSDFALVLNNNQYCAKYVFDLGRY